MASKRMVPTGADVDISTQDNTKVSQIQIYKGDDDILNAGLCICLTLNRAAGLRWKYEIVNNNLTIRNNLARSLLKRQASAIESLKKTFYSSLVDVNNGEDSNGTILWAMHMSGLTGTTLQWVRETLFCKNRPGGLSDSETDSIANLLENPHRAVRFVNDLLNWEIKTLTCLATPTADARAQPIVQRVQESTCESPLQKNEQSRGRKRQSESRKREDMQHPKRKRGIASNASAIQKAE